MAPTARLNRLGRRPRGAHNLWVDLRRAWWTATIAALLACAKGETPENMTTYVPPTTMPASASVGTSDAMDESDSGMDPVDTSGADDAADGGGDGVGEQPEDGMYSACLTAGDCDPSQRPVGP